MATDRDPAIARLWLMTLVRLAGLGLVIAGMAVAGPSNGAPAPLLAGLALMGSGLGIFLFAPKWLVRRWKSGGG